MQRTFWAAGDGNGGFDIGEGNFTIAHVRNLKFQDGYRVAREYAAQIGAEFNPRATAMLMKEAPAMAAALRLIANQSLGPDWTAEEAIAWAKAHAREVLASVEAASA